MIWLPVSLFDWIIGKRIHQYSFNDSCHLHSNNLFFRAGEVGYYDGEYYYSSNEYPGYEGSADSYEYEYSSEEPDDSDEYYGSSEEYSGSGEYYGWFIWVLKFIMTG